MGGSILIVEDEIKIAELLKDYLIKAGYATNIIARGDEVVPFVKKTSPDLIILDIMLPGKDGMDVCRELRTFTRVPIIMLTARVDEIDRILGLELGADDYVCKPFSPREIVARVKAVLRRTVPDDLNKTEDIEGVYVIGPLMLSETEVRVTVDETELTLTPSEFRLLKVLMAKPNRVYSRNELLDQVQGYEFEGYDRTIDTHIKNLRKKIVKSWPEGDIIKTVYGIGYKLVPPNEE